jgi:CheY-like chemotaxis protein
MMPGMDGIETTRRIRELEESRRNAGGGFPNIPIICLSANVVQDAKKLFLSSGMDGFISKPIESAALNGVLKNFLPEGKYTFVEPKNGGVNAGKQDSREEGIRRELATIKELDVARGFHYAADNFETYTLTLKQLSAGMEKGIALILNSLISRDWKSYTVQVHAYKGICATIGAEFLSEWGRKLEMASKSEDKSVCLAETEAFCSALREFNVALHRTSLFEEEKRTDKTEITAEDMTVKLTELAEACEEGRSLRIKAAIKVLDGVCLAGASPEFEAALEEVLDLARSLDYDEAAQKARAISI